MPAAALARTPLRPPSAAFPALTCPETATERSRPLARRLSRPRRADPLRRRAGRGDAPARAHLLGRRRDRGRRRSARRGGGARARRRRRMARSRLRPPRRAPHRARRWRRSSARPKLAAGGRPGVAGAGPRRQGARRRRARRGRAGEGGRRSIPALDDAAYALGLLASRRAATPRRRTLAAARRARLPRGRARARARPVPVLPRRVRRGRANRSQPI